MLVSLNWLKDFVDINVDTETPPLENVVVGYVEKLIKHPNADKLNLATVNIGSKEVKIVCGGENLEEKMYVPVALPGAVLPGNFEIKTTEIRGIESNGMICHLSELGLAESEGRVISPIEKAEPGTPFAKTLKKKGALSPQELSDKLTLKTAEVEQVLCESRYLDNVVTGKLISFKKIENSDKLHEGTIDLGGKTITVVFGKVFKVEEGWILPIALPGAKLPGGKIKETTMQGVKSQGMICGDYELEIVNSETGLTVFPEGTPLGEPINKILKLHDIVLEFDNKSLTHRPDLWGHYGIAREVAVITNQKLKPYNPEVKLPTSGEQVKVDIKDYDLCPRYCGLIIENIKVEESPAWLKARLKAVGNGNHNNVVDVTNYVSAELGQPMHAFDKNFIEGGIIVRRAENGEKTTTLDDKDRELTNEMLVIADHKKTVAIAGVMGGQNSEINENTTSIILEAANFHASNVRKTSTKLGLRTDAVQRFEKSLDPNYAELAILRAAELILKLCPTAKIAGPMTDIKDPTRPELFEDYPTEIELDTEKTASKIGIEISQKEIKKILESLEFQVTKKDDKTITVKVPSHRATKDVTIEDDLVEEVARIYGYENIEATLPTLPTHLPEENSVRFKKHRLRELFSYGLGFDEVINYSFYNKQDLENCIMSEENHVMVENFLSEDQTHMRTSLSPNILKNIQTNLKHFSNFKLYEIGRTYKEIGEFFPLEEKRITAAIVKKRKTDDPFYEAKGALEAFLKKFNLTHVTLTKGIKNTPYAHPNKAVSAIDQSGQTLAVLFMLHPLAAEKHGLSDHSVAILSINLTEAFGIKTALRKYKELSKFPGIKLDISVIIDKTVEVGEIQKAILQSDTSLVTNVELFDIYQGEKVDTNKKAVAFSVTLQALDRTLTDEEMATVQAKIFQALEKMGGEIRGKK